MRSPSDVTVSTLSPCINEKKAFARWVLDHCTTASKVVEIGAGQGRHAYVGEIQASVGRLVGIDPDPRIHQNPFLHERYQVSLEEYVSVCRERYDCIYAFYVIEHVTSPLEFFRRVRELLKPGGSFFIATPNLWHYFGLTTKLTSALGIQEILLRWLRGSELVADYHHRTAYKANSLRRLRKLLDAAGFSVVNSASMITGTSLRDTFRAGSGGYRNCTLVAYKLRMPYLMCTITLRAS